MRWIVLLSLAALCAGLPAQAQVAAPQRQSGESEMDWRLRLYRFAAAPEIRMDEVQRRLALLSPADRALARHHANSIVSAHLRCQRREPGSCEEEARLTGRPQASQQVAAARAAPRPPAPPEPSVYRMRADYQNYSAAVRWNELHPRMRRPSDVIPYWSTLAEGIKAAILQDCVELRSLGSTLGGEYRTEADATCPDFDNRARLAQRAQEMNAPRPSYVPSQPGNASGMVTVRTYDRNGNYTGDRIMTGSQADTIGARPQ